LLRKGSRKGLKVTRKQVDEFLSNENTYSLHKPARRTFKRNKTYVSGIDKQWQADLADMQSLAKDNLGIRYLLTCIDVFSKYAWVIPIKDKSASTMVAGFQELFALAHPRIPTRLQTDKGTEFLCKPVQALLKSMNIHHFVSNSDKKAAVVERFNRTLKSRIWTYFTAKNTKKYIDVLQQFTKSYNASTHRSIGMSPVDVREDDTNTIWRRLYGDGSVPPPLRKRPRVGELVRISRWKGNFEKGYLPNWSKETFHVANVLHHPQTMYEIHDKEGEELKGNFYGKELQRVNAGEYVVEKVLDQRRLRDGSYEVFVKWEGWPAEYNSWVPKHSLRDHA
jgi:transposase InsO family protein